MLYEKYERVKKLHSVCINYGTGQQVCFRNCTVPTVYKIA